MRNRLIVAILLILIGAYGFTKALPLIQGPHIAISSLTTDADGLTHISGTAIHTETLTMDGGTLLIDSNGAFNDTLTLPRGGAILTLTATDRFRRSHTVERTVITP